MNGKVYDLEDRTLKFSVKIIELCRRITKDVITLPIISQLVRSATSIGANYREANGASSKKDFINKIFICKKESKETEYWLLVLFEADQKISEDCGSLLQESKELSMIFSKIASKLK